jgi:hypothetical protein
MRIIHTACPCCGQDIEGNPREGWHDRGGGRACLPFRARDGEIVRPVDLKHSPKLTPRAMLREGVSIEVPRARRARRGAPYRPGYAWVRGWEVRDPATGRYSVPMRYRDAMAMASTELERAGLT